MNVSSTFQFTGYSHLSIHTKKIIYCCRWQSMQVLYRRETQKAENVSSASADLNKLHFLCLITYRVQ